MSSYEILEPGDLVKYQVTDAKKWAEQFVITVKQEGWSINDIDEGLMVAWFASAIETTKDASHG